MVETLAVYSLDWFDLVMSKNRINVRTGKLQDYKDDFSYLIYGALMLKGILSDLVFLGTQH